MQYKSTRPLLCHNIVTTLVRALRERRPMKTDLMQLRLQADEKEAFQEAADLAGLPLSAWVRERLRWAATRELEDASRPVAFLRRRVA